MDYPVSYRCPRCEAVVELAARGGPPTPDAPDGPGGPSDTGSDVC